MTVGRAILWWPPIGVLGMLVLGWAVGNGSTPVDDWFLHDVRRAMGGHTRWLLVFTKWWLLALALLAGVALALYRRHWRLAVLMVLVPLAAIQVNTLLKRLFERYLDDGLAYPSGHTTVLVTVMGMVVVAAGWRLWVTAIAIAVSLLGMVGLACTYHYFTDTVGSALFATAMVCVGAGLAGPSTRGAPG